MRAGVLASLAAEHVEAAATGEDVRGVVVAVKVGVDLVPEREVLRACLLRALRLLESP